MEQGKIMEAEVPTDRVGATPTGLMVTPSPQPPSKVFTGRMPFVPPNQQRQSTEGTTSKLLTDSETPTAMNWSMPALTDFRHLLTLIVCLCVSYFGHFVLVF